MVFLLFSLENFIFSAILFYNETKKEFSIMKNAKNHLSFESNQKTCSKKMFSGDGVPCPYMSSVKFDASGRMYWECTLFNRELKDDNKWLVRCKDCIEEFSNN